LDAAQMMSNKQQPPVATPTYTSSEEDTPRAGTSNFPAAAGPSMTLPNLPAQATINNNNWIPLVGSTASTASSRGVPIGVFGPMYVQVYMGQHCVTSAYLVHIDRNGTRVEIPINSAIGFM
jgi:hypothetical protein